MPAPGMLENLSPFVHLKGTTLIWCITLSSASAFLLFGYDQGVLGGLTTQPTFLTAMGVSPSEMTYHFFSDI